MKTSGGIGGGSSVLGWKSYSVDLRGGIQLGRLRTDMYEFLKFQNLNYEYELIGSSLGGWTGVCYLYELDIRRLHEDVEARPITARC
jgi:hypothetical protein